MAFQKNIQKKLLPLAFLLVANNLSAMTNFVTEIEIMGKKPFQIYAFMFGLDKPTYQAWHPEHKDYKVIKQTKDTLGSVFFFSEKMDNLTVKYKWEVVQLAQNQKIVMKAKYPIPIFLTLTFTQTQNGTLVTHDLQIGGRRKSPLFDFFIRKFIFSKRKAFALERHTIEEFKNLESLIK